MGARHVDLQLRERMVYRREKRAMALELGTERAQGAQHKTEQQGRQGIRETRRALDEERARLDSEHAARTEVHVERTTKFDAHLKVAVAEEMQKKEEHFDIDRRAADLAEAVARLRDQAVLVGNLQAGLGQAEAGMAARDGTITGLEGELERTRVRMVAAEAQVMAEAGQRAEEAAAAEQEKTEEAKARDETEQKREEAHEANEDKLVVDHSRKFEADGSDQAIKFSVSEVHAYPEGGMGIWDLSHLSEDARKAGVAGLVMDRHGLHLYVLERWSLCAVCVGGYYTGFVRLPQHSRVRHESEKMVANVMLHCDDDDTLLCWY